MSLQLIMGSSGSGKSRYILNDIIKKSTENKDNEHIIIVPEQFTMETQKNIVSLHPMGGAMNIDIQSFMRMAVNVFNEVGVRTGVVLDDTGKSLILRKVIEKEKSSLSVYGGRIKQAGFVQKVKSIVSEFYQYGIGTKELEKLLDNSSVSPLLRGKLKDVRVIFDAFDRYIDKDYIPSEEVLKVLCNYISESEVVKNSEFYIDGFAEFTPVQYELLGLMMRYAKKVSVTIALPSYKVNETRMAEQDLFLLSIKMKNRLLNLAKENGIEIEDNIIMEDKLPIRYKESESLAFLERNIFRYSKSKYAGETSDIFVNIAMQPRDEIEIVASKIKELVRTKGYRYKDIAIVTGSMETYYRIFEKELSDAKIPCFIDHKRSIFANPFADAIRSIIEILKEDFSYEAVFRFLRTGMSDLSIREVDILENSVLAMGIRGFKGWNKEWENVDENINEIKKKVVKEFSDIVENISKGKQKLKKVTECLREFVSANNMESKLDAYVKQFEESGDLSRYKEYSQIYDLVMELFEKMFFLLGEEEVTLSEYADILDAGLLEIKVGIIPPSVDCVVAGDIKRTRLNNIKVLFFVGVNDGIVPSKEKDSGILTENDRKCLKDFNIELTPGTREKAFIQKFYLYINMTKPKNKLYVSYHLMDSDGKTAHPSYLIAELKKMFGESIVSKDMEFDERISTEGLAIKYLADSIRDMDTKHKLEEMDDNFKELFSYFFRHDEYNETVEKLIEAACYKHYDNPIDRGIAKKLYGENMSNSISRLEKFASCPYSHFLQYGLALKERKIFEIKVSDIGSLYHAAIEHFSNMVNESYTWDNIEENVRLELVEKSIVKAVEESDTKAFDSTARNEYMLQKIRNMTDTTTKVLCEQVKKGRFVPTYFELKFSPEDGADSMCMKLDESSVMNLRGIVDRVDIYRECDESGKPKKIYIKIIDYKSGNKDFKINDVYDGRQLQLSMYMHAVADMEKNKYPDAKIIPAAELYYRIRAPYVDKYNDKGENDSAIRRLDEYKMPGLINNDEDILELLDTDIVEKGTSSVIKISRNKNGKYNIPNSTNTTGFEKLGEFMEEKSIEMGRKIINGDVSVTPCKEGTSVPCSYCEFTSICRFNTNITGYEYRNISKLKPEEVWKRIIKSEGEVNEDGE